MEIAIPAQRTPAPATAWMAESIRGASRHAQLPVALDHHSHEALLDMRVGFVDKRSVQTVGGALEAAWKAALKKQHVEALDLLGDLISQVPACLEARLRVGCVLRELGADKEANALFTRVGQMACEWGHPFISIASLKLMSHAPQLTEPLAVQIAARYAASANGGAVGSRVSLPIDTTPLRSSAPPAPPAPEGDAELRAAAQRAFTTAYAVSSMDVVVPERVPPVALFRALSPDGWLHLIEKLKLHYLESGSVVVRQKEAGDSLFIVVSGRVTVFRYQAQHKEERVSALMSDAVFGELSFLNDVTRTASVRTDTATMLLELKAEALSCHREEYQRMRESVRRFASKRLLHHLLETAELFQPLDYAQRRDLLKYFKHVEVKKGNTIIEKGSRGEGLFLVFQGEVRVSATGRGDETLAELGPGQICGEMALLARDQAASAWVTASEDTELLFLESRYFLRLVEAFPSVANYVQQLRRARMRSNAETRQPQLVLENLQQSAAML